ncbi:T-box transcription factor TBX6 [Rhipicephalus microplus]|uniref:T-box transcription factor TBX6 n=1 Tax=Rhipicephalus microplus TaxID=6941 RepID=UPI003F6CDB4D
MTENEQAISTRLPLLPSAALPSPFQPRNPEPVVHPAQLPCAALDNVHLTLENKELWTRFYLLGNEMIITRPGRRMFPVMRVKVTGMEPTSYYMMLMTFVARDHYRYRFLSNCWLPVETATDPPASESNMYLHESGPCLGAKWMLAPVDFGAVKLTNQKSNSSQKVMLQSMRKYVPYIHVFAGSDVQQLDFRRFKTFMFPETEFISVTSYQNDQIIALKIQNNPYARSFCSNTDRRNAIRRLTDEELGSGDDTAGHSGIALHLDPTFENPFRAPPTASTTPATCTGSATPIQPPLSSFGPTLPNGSVANTLPPSQSPYARCAPSEPLFSSLAPYATPLDLYSSLYSVAPPARYASNLTAGMGDSLSFYFQPHLLSSATAPAPYILSRFVGGSQCARSAVSTPSVASLSSALSASSAMPCATTLASALETVSHAAPITSRLPIPFGATTASEHARHDATL